MKTPWVNLLLLFTLIAQAVSGYLGLLINQSRFNWVLWLHGIGAYTLVLLVFWKGNIIFSAIRRKTVWTWHRIAFIFTVFLLLLTLVLGLLWTFNGPQYFLTISYVSWHIYVAVPLMLLMLWHSWHMRFVFRVGEARNRRAFMLSGLMTVAGLATWRLVGWGKTLANVPGAARRFTGSYERGSFGGWFPSVVWIADKTPNINPDQYTLSLTGAVADKAILSYADLRQRAKSTQTAILDCTGGWYTTQEWTGVALSDLLALSEPNAAAQSVTVKSATGYQRRFTLAQAETMLLALDVAGQPLDAGHGFPCRLVAGDMRGVEWVKWVTEIEVNTTSSHWQVPLPIQ